MFNDIKNGEVVKVKHKESGTEFEFIRYRDYFFDRRDQFGKGYSADHMNEKFEII